MHCSNALDMHLYLFISVKDIKVARIGHKIAMSCKGELGCFFTSEAAKNKLTVDFLWRGKDLPKLYTSNLMVYIINPNSPNLCPAKKPGLTVIFQS